MGDKVCDQDGSAANEFVYVVKGCEQMMTGARGKMWVLSDPFTIMGLTWQLQIYPHILEQGSVKFSIWMVLLDVELLPADDLPYVRCRLTIINQVDRAQDLPSMMNAQYTSVGNANRARRCLASLEHSRLMALRHDLMRDGDMQLRVHIDRIMTAKQRAVLCKCSVHDLLSGLEPNSGSAAEKAGTEEVDCQQVAEWVAGGGKDLGASEMAVSNAIAGNASLCKRIHACQGASMPSSEAEFSGAVRAVQNMLGCQGATAEVLEYFGGEKPHAALVKCLAVDPAGLLRHISAAVGPKAAPSTGRATQHAGSSHNGRQPLLKRVLRALRDGA